MRQTDIPVGVWQCQTTQGNATHPHPTTPHIHNIPHPMPFNPDKHHRRSIRLKGHNYSSTGIYFITICTYQRQCLFGEIAEQRMQLNEYGQVAKTCWLAIPKHFPNTKLSEFVVMPNHLHGILTVTKSPPRYQRNGARAIAPESKSSPVVSLKRKFGTPIAGSLATIIGSFKSAATKRINILRHVKGTPLWQRNYYEHVIRDESALRNIQHYIKNNPRVWGQDQLHPDNPSKW